MCVGITIIKWDSTCHSQTHGTEPPVHFCCSHYISPCFLSTSPFHSLFLSLAFSFFLSLSLSLSLSLYLCPLFLSVVARHMSSDALYQIFSSWSILLFHTISFHSSYKNHQLFTDYLLRLPSSELLEKHLFRSRANRRLVSWFIYLFMEVEGPSIRFPGGCCSLHGRAPLSPEGGSAGLVPWELAQTSPSPHRRRPRQRWICPGMDRAEWSRRWRQLQPGTWWEQHLELYENESGDGLGVSLRWCDCDF